MIIRTCHRYGPDGRTGRDYNLTELHHSRVATALAKLGVPIPSDEKIVALRKEADVSCKKPADASPCKPTQQVYNEEYHKLINVPLKVCLFKIDEDPCELNNLVFKFPDVVRVGL